MFHVKQADPVGGHVGTFEVEQRDRPVMMNPHVSRETDRVGFPSGIAGADQSLLGRMSAPERGPDACAPRAWDDLRCGLNGRGSR